MGRSRVWRIAVLLLSVGCATSAPPQAGTSGQVTWRLKHVRFEASDKARIWHYMLVLHETTGVGITFQHAVFRFRVGSVDLPEQQQTTANLRLEANSEIHLPLRSGFEIRPSPFATVGREWLYVSAHFVGTTDRGQRVRFLLDYSLDPHAPPARPAATSATVQLLLAEATALLNQGKLTESKSKLEDVLRSSLDPDTRAKALITLATVFLQMGELKAAQARAEEAVTSVTEALELAAVLPGWEQRLRELAGTLAEVLAGVESIRAKLGDHGRASFTGTSSIQDLYERLIAAISGPANASPSFELAEQGRARVLREQLAGIRGGVTLPPQLANEERSLVSNVLLSRTGKDFALLIPGMPRGTGEFGAPGRELNAFIERLRQDAEPRIRSYANLKYPVPVVVDDVQRSLRPDEVLLEYKVTSGKTVLWIVRPNRPIRLVVVSMGRVGLRRLVNELLDTISRDPGKPFDQRPARALYDLLLKRALTDVDAGASLVVVPDESLFLVPFEALVRGDAPGEAPEYLAQRHPVSYYPSAGTLVLMRAQAVKRERPSLSLLAVGDPVVSPFAAETSETSPTAPTTTGTRAIGEAMRARGYLFPPLPATALEVRAIARVLGVPPSAPHVLMREEATKARVLSRLSAEGAPGYRFIHLATHGVLSSDVPEMAQPALLLSGKADSVVSDVFLTMQELANTRLASDLMVLSACQTGRGEEVPGEGVLGLGRAALDAGAASVVVSLWNVADDATATFMARFYTHMVVDRLNRAQALRQTRLEFIRAQRESHPFFWAPFILIGETGAAPPLRSEPSKIAVLPPVVSPSGRESIPGQPASVFSQFAGFAYGQTIKDVIARLGAPEAHDRNEKYSFDTVYYFGRGLTIMYNRETSVITAVIVGSDGAARLRALGVMDPNFDYLGQSKESVIAAFGQPRSINAGFHDYPFKVPSGGNGKASFYCPDRRQQRCEKIYVWWFAQRP